MNNQGVHRRRNCRQLLTRDDFGPGASRHALRLGSYGKTMRGVGMQLMFGLLDTDGDGSLSEDEVQRTVSRVFSSIDENGDSKIDQDEIQSFMHGSSTHGPNSGDMP